MAVVPGPQRSAAPIDLHEWHWPHPPEPQTPSGQWLTPATTVNVVFWEIFNKLQAPFITISKVICNIHLHLKSTFSEWHESFCFRGIG